MLKPTVEVQGEAESKVLLESTLFQLILSLIFDFFACSRTLPSVNCIPSWIKGACCHVKMT